MKLQQVILHLSLIDGIGPQTIQKIIKSMQNSSLDSVYSFSSSDFMQMGLSHKVATVLVDGLKDVQTLQRELALIEKHGIQWLSCIDVHYPELLKNIHQPPVILYWKGNLTLSSNRIAVVGSRKTNNYGARVIESIVPALVTHDFEIVSGGALGADTMAHQETVRTNGKTIVVFGSGLLQPYPRENKKLFEHIIEHDGVLMSSFPLQTTPHPGNFPARNRIIAGLSKGVVVIQAAEKSGARITAQLALEEGRDVFAIPGSVDDELSAGCHALIKEGAKLTTCADDILEEYGMGQEVSVLEPRIPRAAAHISLHQAPIQKTILETDPVKHLILLACKKPCAVDDLSAQTNLELAALQEKLFDMQLDGLIAQDFMGMWKTE